jgi:hypothetical protein
MHAVDDAPEVDVHHPAPVVERVFPNVAEHFHTGVVADDVCRAIVIPCGVGEGFDLFRFAHVGAAGEHFGAVRTERVRCRFEPVGFDVGDDEFHALGGERFRHCETDSACSTRDYSYLALQVLH